jgi:hypothetical protein
MTCRRNQSTQYEATGERPMTDADIIKAKKDYWWNFLVLGLAALLLLVGWELGRHLIRTDQPTESIKVIAVVTEYPHFL